MDCQFCDEFQTGKFVWKGREMTPRLVRREPFIVFPTIGDFLEGWTLISPEAHMTSVASMPTGFFPPLENLLSDVRKALSMAYENPTIVFEHGMGGQPHCGPACVEHSHLHIIPTKIDILPDIAAHFTGQKFDQLRDLSKLWQGKPYLFYENQASERNFFGINDVIPSQYLRQLLWSKIARSGWDWKTTPRLESFEWASRRLEQLFLGHKNGIRKIQPSPCPACAGDDLRCVVCSPPEGACPFCDPKCIDSRIILESDNFFVIPTKGQVTSGYCLVIPKRHELCLGEMSREHMGELITIKEKVQRAIQEVYGVTPICFEHGQSGQSVAHAHLHIAPSPVNLFPKILEDQPRVRKIESLYELRGVFQKERAYLFYEDGQRNKFVFSVFRVPQYLRIVFAEMIGRPERGDWRKMDPILDEALMDETQNKIKSTLT